MAKKSNLIEFIEKAIKIHGDKYDYSKSEYINDKTKLCIICPEHGEFWQDPHTHLKGNGCRKCYWSNKYNTITFIEKAKKIHGDKYDYSKAVYNGSHKKVCIICPEHGEFWQEAKSHLKGNGCPKCDKSYKLNSEIFIEKAKQVHGNKYDYSKVNYINNRTPVCIICPEHGEFWQEPKHHLNGYGCQICKESKLEKSMREVLDENEIFYIEKCNNKYFNWLGKQHLDFYLPDYNIAIECQGIQHFEENDFFSGNLEDRKLLDEKKFNLCKKNGINMIYYSNLGILYPYNVYEDKNKIINIIKNG
jgi:pyridoxine/pyridoxamine 5'-phosphate oxidase